MNYMVYKNIKVYKMGYLDVGESNKIYYELSGNPKGNPVISIHGGPGGGFSRNDKRFFNPKWFNIITFDQRGSGKSRPFASIKNNTTFRLADDIKKLLEHLRINKIILFGGSWGSTLGLVYAIKYPETVKAVVIRGIFLGNKEENDYLIYNAKDTFPEAWVKMIRLVPEKYRKNIMKYYLRMILSKDRKISKRYSYAWAEYEFSVSKLVSNEKKVRELLKKIKYEAFSKIELHYLINNCFLPKDFILKNAYRLRSIPITIVHGRYDNVCPPISAYKLHRRIPSSRLIFTIAGHSASDEETEKVLIREMDKLKNI